MSALKIPVARPPETAAARIRAIRGSAADTAMIEGWAGGTGWKLARGDLALPNALLNHRTERADRALRAIDLAP